MGGSGAGPEDGAVLPPEVINDLVQHALPLVYHPSLVKAGLASNIFFKRDDKIWDRTSGREVVESGYLPSPPKNHPPKPERAFWRGAPRKGGRR